MRRLTDTEKSTILKALDLYSEQGSYLEDDKQIEAAERAFALVEVCEVYVEEPKR